MSLSSSKGAGDSDIFVARAIVILCGGGMDFGAVAQEPRTSDVRQPGDALRIIGTQLCRPNMVRSESSRGS